MSPSMGGDKLRSPTTYSIDSPFALPAKRQSSVLIVLLLITVTFSRLGGASAAAQVDTPINVAGVVVDYGDGRTSYALVPFEEETISGVELLRRSGLSLLSVEFGGMGEGVCAIEDTGCDLSACRARLCQTGDPDSPFWQYVRDDGEGGWQPASLGASSSMIEHRDVDGWFWTDSAPRTDALTLDDIASETGVDLETFSASEGANLEPVVVTNGDTPGSDAMDQGSVLTGLAIVAGMAALGGFLIVRNRRST
ncbi:MAG: hypothetical protein M3457_16360 [Chloroflexota bacterium]|nr:hypothetical protein [Chloroflexota bacterium]